MALLYLDLETRSRYDVTEYGVDAHARHAEIILAGWAVGDGPVHLWELGEDPSPFQQALAEHERLIAHNAWFEHNVLWHTGWCDRPLDAWHCTMAQAFAHAMPGGLDLLCKFLGLPAEYSKRPDGKRLIRLFSQPQKDGSFLTKNDRPEDWAQFREYGHYDVEAVRAVHHRLPRINLHECC